MLSVALDDIKKNGGTSLKKKYYISISLLMTIIVLVFDQVSKWLITISMKVGDSYEIIPNFLNITSHRNNGAAWGILSGKMLFFYIITIIILIVLVGFVPFLIQRSRLIIKSESCTKQIFESFILTGNQSYMSLSMAWHFL